MAKYKKRDSSTWTLSSSSLGCGAVVSIVVVALIFGLGMYIGYRWGMEEAREPGREETIEDPGRLAERMEEFDDIEDTDDIPGALLFDDEQISEPDLDALDEEEIQDSPEAPGREPPRPYTEEELGFIDEPPPPEEEQVVVPEPEDEECDQPTRRLQVFYTIQAAASQKRENAERSAAEFEEQGHTAVVREAYIRDEPWYRVRVGEFPTRREAREYAEQMEEDGKLEDYWISRVERD